MFKVLLQQILPTMAAMEHRQPTIPTEETGENKIEAVPSMAAKVLSPQKRYFDTLHVTVARLIYLTWMKWLVGENLQSHDFDYLQIVTSDGLDKFIDSMQSSTGSRVLMGLWYLMIQVHAHPNAGGNGGFPHGGHVGRRTRVPAHNPTQEHLPERKVDFHLLYLLSTLIEKL